MPIPTVVAKLNRYVANPVVRQFAGRIAPLALLVHRGRSSGDEYRTPLLAFPTESGFVIALVYGRGTDWERNVVSAGKGVLVYRGRRHMFTSPAPIPENEARGSLPAPVRFALPLIGVHEFLHLTTSARQ